MQFIQHRSAAPRELKTEARPATLVWGLTGGAGTKDKDGVAAPPVLGPNSVGYAQGCARVMSFLSAAVTLGLLEKVRTTRCPRSSGGKSLRASA